METNLDSASSAFSMRWPREVRPALDRVDEALDSGNALDQSGHEQASSPARPRGRPRLKPHVHAAGLPALVTVDDAARLLRTSRHAVYAMLERGQLPVPIRVGRRLLLRQDELLHWLDQKRAPSLKE